MNAPEPVAAEAAGAMGRWIAGRARARAARGGARSTRAATGLYDLASNDYLSLARDPRLAAAASAAEREFGTSAAASRVVVGTLPVHEELETSLCALTGRGHALAFSSGYTANLGLLGALGGPGTTMILDEHVHASLVDGARLSRSRTLTAAHNRHDDVARLLAARDTPRAVVAVESVYSVLGDAADLAGLAAVCAEHDAVLVVDEAHSIGVHGAGAVAAAGLAHDPRVVTTATLSKALGAQGGAVLGSGDFGAALREHLVDSARTFVFDTGLAPGPAAAAAQAARIVAADPALPGRLAERSAQIVAALAPATGLDVGCGAVHSARVGSAEGAAAAAAELRRRGIAAGCFRPPSVPDGISRLRFTARAGQEPGELGRALDDVVSVVSGIQRKGIPA
ncbi:aminotransferase class I/II-fold pyridoxal phosphate-dependent enzyme [Zhihengliuella halotolerans]|uniref:8-amino-7-oxononanoate synthase n=1 Tax=Zhihengliuella halotolerans TaxID=370736 RepID=A0A4Q8AHW0_9MICC|nr:aminotransferase class I/II-fold pyridoxal phosphate-dependent enzyme [Zhihengliuella halotolerans]RZU63501.1 8-amino-7-oxononanoate synthase [Zhihengliuella halotolerans]